MARLAAEEAPVLFSESHAVVARLRADVGTPVEVFDPQTRLPGARARLIWGRLEADVGGSASTLHLFSMWLAFSTQAFHRAYVHEAQESFTDAHV